MNRIWIPQPVHMVLNRLEQAGFAAYIVGGCVRDSLHGLCPHDWDVCTAATPAQMHQILQDFALYDTGLPHGTITAVIEHMPIEITTFRTEGNYSDGRRPDTVTFVTDITLDLSRRDFTINAMAYSPLHGICDPFDGQADLAKGILRCVGDADIRFTEDGLRILRALRFAAVYGFTIAPQTAQALHRQANRLTQIAAERLQKELLRLLCGAYVGTVLREYRDIIACFCPEISPMFDFAQYNAHHLYDVWEHTIRAVEQIPATPVLRMAMLLHDAGKPATFTKDENGVGHFYGHPKISAQIAKQLLSRLRFPKQMQEEIVLLVDYHDRPLADNPRLLRRQLSRIGEHAIRQLLAVKKADCVGQGTHRNHIRNLLETEALLNQVLQENICYQPNRLAVNGYDLMTLGLQGKQIGEMQRTLFAYVLENPQDNQKTTLLCLAKQALERNYNTL